MPTDTAQYRIRGDGAASIAASIEEGVTSGRLRPGTELPSVRSLAGDLGVSPTTVASAYRDLKRRGVVATQERSRTVVSHRPPLVSRPTIEVPHDARDLITGNPDPALLPPLEELAAGLRLPVKLYGERSAVPALIERAQADLAADGITADDLVVVSGALDGMERVLDAHLRMGDRVAIEDPGYSGFVDLCRSLGLELVPVAVDDEGMRPEALVNALARDPAAIILTPRAHNPRGAALTEQRARELRVLLEDHPGVLVVEDDHCGEVAGTPPLTLTTGRERWAVVRSLAKTLGPDLRIGVLSADPQTAARVLGRQRLGCGWVSHVLQHLTLAAWDHAEREGLLRRAATTYALRRDALIGALADRDIPAHGRSGLNVWVPVVAESPVVQGLLQRGWAVQPGDHYRLESPPAVRVTTATLEPDDAARFASDLDEVLHSAPTTRRG